MTKYKRYFQEMLTANEGLFRDFKKVHDLFATDRLAHQEEFNRQGRVINEIIQEWEKRLCSKMEGSKNSVYSTNLSEKFRAEIKNVYPLIDFIGVKLTIAP